MQLYGKTAMKKVLLVQLPHPSIVDRNIPLAAGYLKAYAAHAGMLNEIAVDILEPKFNRSGCQMIINAIMTMKPDVVGFSLYIWNVERTLYTIRKLRAVLPKLIVMVGGPELNPSLVTKDIDLAVFGEGEKAFVAILKYILDGSPELLDEIAGIGYWKNGNFVLTRPSRRIENLEDLPSPYLLGYLDPNSYREMMVFTMRGCLQGCSYCAWSGRGRLRPFPLQQLREELELARSSGKSMNISILDSAFNTSPVFEDFCRMLQAINQDGLLKFDCFVRADLVDRHTARLLKESNFTGVEVGLQTTNSRALNSIRRSMNLEDFLRGIKILSDEGVPVKVDTILGLPGDTRASFEDTMQFIQHHQLDPIIFNLSLGHGAQLRRHSEQFGIRMQPAAPYYVLETATFPENDLRAALERHVESSADFDRMINLAYPVILSHREGETEEIANLHELDQQIGNYPIHNLVVSVGNRMSQAVSVADLADFVSRRTASNFSVLLRGSVRLVTESLDWLRKLLERVSTMNPFITWDIHVETLDGVPGQAFVDEIRSSIHKPKVFLDYRDEFFPPNLRQPRRRAVNLFVYVPYSPGIVPTLNSASLIYTVKLGRNAPEAARSLLQVDGYALLIDFVPGTPVDAIRATMHLLNSPGKSVFFKDWVIQRLWEQEFLRVTPGSQSHFEVLVDQDFNLVGKYFDENELMWDAIIRWRMIKPEYSSMDLVQLMIDKVSARATKAVETSNQGASIWPPKI